MNAQVGETVTLEVSIKGVGKDPVTFDIKIGDEVLATVPGTTKDFTSTGTWKVDVGQRQLPVDVTFTAKAKDKAVSSGTLRVDPAPPVIGPIGPSAPVKNAEMMNGVLVVDVGTQLPMTTTITTDKPADLEVFVVDVPKDNVDGGQPLGAAIFTQKGVSGGMKPATVTVPWDVKPSGTPLVRLRCDVKIAGNVVDQKRSNLVVLADWVDVTMTDAPGTAEQGKEGRERHVFLSGQPVPEVPDGKSPAPPPVTAQRLAAWAHTGLAVELDGVVPAQGQRIPDEQGHVRMRWAHGAAAKQIAIRAQQTRYGAAWHDAAASGAGTSHPVQARGQVTLPVTARRRLSLWLSPAEMFAWPGGGAWPMDEEHGQRWDKLKAYVDDVVLLGVFKPAFTDGGATVTYAYSAEKGLESSLSQLRAIIAKCHDNQTQVLIGHGGIINEIKQSPWLSYLDAAADVSDDKLKVFAQAICKQIFDTDKLPFDGLDFDLEHLTQRSWSMRLRQRVRVFFRALATELQVRKKLLGIASSSYISHGAVQDNVPATGSAQGQTFTLAIECPNIIMRPMCYDNAFLGDQLLDFQRRIVKFALADAPAGAGLHPAQFQVGVKTFKGTNNSDAPSVPGHPGENIKGYYTNMPTQLTTLCKDTLMPSRVGVICFGPPFMYLKQIDDALNPLAGDKKQGKTVGTPLQGPLVP